MPTINVEVVENQIIVAATITVPPDGPMKGSFQALVDTGAQSTMISQKLSTRSMRIPWGGNLFFQRAVNPWRHPYTVSGSTSRSGLARHILFPLEGNLTCAFSRSSHRILMYC